MQGLGLLVILFFFGLAGGIVGRIKGSSFTIWFLVSGCVPFIGLLAAISYRHEDRELRRQCPRCRQVLKLYDAVCTRCGMELEFPAVALVPESSPQPLRRSARGAPANGSPGRA
ncbi:MAG: hypothetical protein M3016_02600 [Actinomycetota bacterium]|nr:hypothetical protein [Actinomycetota bacterium]